MAGMLCLFAAVVMAGVPLADGSIDVRMSVPAEAGGRAVPATESALLRFELPRKGSVDSAWVVRAYRMPVDAVWVQRGPWRSQVHDFFSPDRGGALLPGGYLFPLPQDWQGGIELELHAPGGTGDVLAPRVMREADAMRLEQFGVATSAMIYASLFTIGLLALALFYAARDRIFLELFVYVLMTLLTLSALNGHLYQVPGLRRFAFWREQGLWALGLLLSAAWLRMLMQYADPGQLVPAARRAVEIACRTLAGLAALCLLNLSLIAAWMPTVGALAWVATVLLGIAVLVDACRRRVAMAWPLLVLTLLTAAAILVQELAARAQVLDMVVVHYGYQLGIVVGVAILSVGLISRIGEYRHQRDRESLARADTERRMRREAARSELVAELQAKLRTLPVGDIGWNAFRLLIDHLARLIPVESSAVMAHGYHEQNLLVVEPVSLTEAMRLQVERRGLAMKRQSANGIPFQQPVTSETAQSVIAISAVVPLRIRAPAWGALMLQRGGTEGFTTEELALAGDFARLTLAQIDHAVTAVDLRRSAELDALTGSFNRRTIDQWLARTFADAVRDQHPIAVLFIDLDNFKAINDRHGHACGDFCLRTVAATLRATLQDGDLFGRYGGEEFIVILPGRGGAAARTIAEDLRTVVDNLRLEWDDRPLRLTVSVGVAVRHDGEDLPAATLERADKALYQAKRDGRNLVHVAPAVFS